MKSLSLIGNIGTDALINNNGNYSVLNFTVAVNERKKQPDGSFKDVPAWFSAALWREKEKLEKLLPYFKKGVKIFVQGDFKSEVYKEQIKLTVQVDTFELLTSKL